MNEYEVPGYTEPVKCIQCGLYYGSGYNQAFCSETCAELYINEMAEHNGQDTDSKRSS